MKISIVGSKGFGIGYGGFETIVREMVPILAERCEVSVTGNYNRGDVAQGIRLVHIGVSANGPAAALHDLLAILKTSGSDWVIVLGPSAGVLLPLLKLIFRFKLAVHVDGIEWKREKWGLLTRVLIFLNERFSIFAADLCISDNKAVTQYLENIVERSRILEVGYGGDHVSESRPTFCKDVNAYFICRIEPENNIHMILEAIDKCERSQLVAIGNWEVSEYARRLKKQFLCHSRIRIFDPIYDQKMLGEIIGNCNVCIHGHSVGGTNPALVEAIFRGVDIFAFDCDFNRATLNNGYQYFSSVDELRKLLLAYDPALMKSTEMAALIGDLKLGYRWDVVADGYFEGLKGASLGG